MSDKVAGKKRAASSEPEVDHRFDEIGDFDEEEAEAGPSTSTSTPKPKTKSTSTSTKSKKRKTIIPGIVYISRLPPGMTPQKVKYLMAQWGDVGKIYAQKKDGTPLSYNRIDEMEIDSSSDWI
jgi:ESF2/ABP1 family protein